MTLNDWLTRSRAWDAEYGDKLASHLPMVLTALDRLGATRRQTEAFVAHYTQQLHPAPSLEDASALWGAPGDGRPGGWLAGRGQVAAWPWLRVQFAAQIQTQGIAATLAHALPELMPGVGAAAFHGLIRVGYAIDAGHPGELADALAYWACRWFALQVPEPGLAALPAQADPMTVLAGLALPRPTAPLIAERMAMVAGQPAVAQAVAQWVYDAAAPLANLQTLGETAAKLYIQTGHFTVLHLVTSAHAMRVCLGAVPEVGRAPALQHYWAAFVAAYASCGPLLTKPAQPKLAWRHITERTLASLDDHLVKLVDTSLAQEATYGGDVWRKVASVALAPAVRAATGA